ncbi:hypothetical protein [Fulvimarina manganoxydans]|uniref:hypothetical protein n=1 Tax=Fulvimarina manganoxydans TaxID=937218 RepID=UPI00111BD460|nr:hypothetical protein [Fulvimarina manganoxydans]
MIAALPLCAAAICAAFAIRDMRRGGSAFASRSPLSDFVDDRSNDLADLPRPVSFVRGGPVCDGNPHLLFRVRFHVQVHGGELTACGAEKLSIWCAK